MIRVSAMHTLSYKGFTSRGEQRLIIAVRFFFRNPRLRRDNFKSYDSDELS